MTPAASACNALICPAPAALVRCSNQGWHGAGGSVITVAAVPRTPHPPARGTRHRCAEWPQPWSPRAGGRTRGWPALGEPFEAVDSARVRAPAGADAAHILICQSDQILQTEVRSARSRNHERIGRSEAGPTTRQTSHAAVGISVKDSVLAELSVLSRQFEMSVHTTGGMGE